MKNYKEKKLATVLETKEKTRCQSPEGIFTNASAEEINNTFLDSTMRIQTRSHRKWKRMDSLCLPLARRLRGRTTQKTGNDLPLAVFRASPSRLSSLTASGTPPYVHPESKHQAPWEETEETSMICSILECST